MKGSGGGGGGAGDFPRFYKFLFTVILFRSLDFRSIDFNPIIKRYINKDLIFILITIIIIIFTSQLPTMSLGRVA